MLTKDNKTRFEVSAGKIRARHGHTVNLLRPPWSSRPVQSGDLENLTVMHATSSDNWKLIRTDGYLRPMERQAIHFATDAGLLRHRPVLIYVDAQKAINDGIPFFWSTDKILVCPEPIPLNYLSLDSPTASAKG